jgi:beta-N-acetylhexosaminidase
MAGSLGLLCGQLLLMGLAGPELSEGERRALGSGKRGGVVLFARNVRPAADGPSGVLALTNEVRRQSPTRPLVAIDQEGGRVVRIGPPALALPAMRRIGELGDPGFASRLAEAQARELAAMGLTMSFAPVADVHTHPDNPVIGERAFATTPAEVTRFAKAWAEGLSRGGVLSCAKHFPGHGDTSVDSHLALPRVDRSREELDRVEIAPFRDLARDPNVASMMVAHVVFPGLGTGAGPSSLSPAVCTHLLRNELGFEGVLFSDDLEMKAIQLPMGEAAVLAIGAGCDALLICHRDELVEEALDALVREAETSPAFRARCEEAHGRFVRMKEGRAPAPATDAAALTRVLEASAPIAAELTARLAGAEKERTA